MMFKTTPFLPDTRLLPWARLQIPNYKSGKYGNWNVKLNDIPVARGYFRGLQNIKANYVLSKNKKTVMSTTPMEIESHMPHLASSRGHTVIVGLGLGLMLYNVLGKKSVKHATLIEKDPAIVTLLTELGMPSWNGYNKLSIMITDVFDITNEFEGRDIDFLYIDIWDNLGQKTILRDVIAIQKVIKAKQVGWWGQELDFISWCNKKGLSPPPTEEEYYEFMKDVGLPMNRFKGCSYSYWCLNVAENVVLY
jgi:hypothetical protein